MEDALNPIKISFEKHPTCLMSYENSRKSVFFQNPDSILVLLGSFGTD